MLITWFQALKSGFEIFMATHQYMALFSLLALEEAGLPLPVPGDMFIMLLGYRVALGLANPLLVVFNVALATFLGSSLLYAIARRLGRAAVASVGRFILLDEKRLAQMECWMAERGTAGIVVGRLIPGLRTPTSIAAGIFGVPYRTFAPATAFSAVVWAMIYMLLGMVFGAHQIEIVGLLVANLPLVAIIVAVVISVVVMTVLVRRNWQRIIANVSTLWTSQRGVIERS